LVFSATAFLFFFLPVTIALYAIAPTRFRNGLLLAASWLFYLWGGGRFTFILLGSTVVNWLLGRLADEGWQLGKPRLRTLAIAIAAVFNLGLLGYFKYANFFVDQLRFLGGIDLTWTPVLLPIGISFFTFQSLSYVVDVARGDAPVQRRWDDLALYVVFFPQLIAGPIVRYRDLAAQLQGRSHRWENVTRGMLRFAHGLVKKILIADSVGRLADAAFGAPAELTGSAAWLGLMAYTLQIYFDFSGYSDMAIGLGRIFGFRLPENFCRPYCALSVTDFWRRWHITLSHWFRDYVYIPLGGSRGGGLQIYRNLGIVFLLTGLWHGANWTFILWGVFHGAILILERRLNGRLVQPNPGMSLAAIAGRRALTFLLVCLGWVLFRAPDLPSALAYYQALGRFGDGFGLSDAIATEASGMALTAIAIGSILALWPAQISAGRFLDWSPSWAAVGMRLGTACITFPLALMLSVANNFSPFLYFQF
jgi:alginate O-acetyltransferase complex protein AlgI